MVKTYRQLKKIIDDNHYELIHTQSPIGGVVCRLAARKARKNGTKVIYTAHGFHFFPGHQFKIGCFSTRLKGFAQGLTICLLPSIRKITIGQKKLSLAKGRVYSGSWRGYHKI